MKVYKRKSLNRKMVATTKSLLESFSFLFYVCKILGVNSQDLKEFRRYKLLKKSTKGEVLVIIGIIVSFINYNLMLLTFRSKTYLREKNLLTVGISIVLTYYSVALLICDRLYALIKQQKFLNIFKELEIIDEDLRHLNIVLNNDHIKYCLVWRLFLAAILETLIFAITFILFVDKVNWSAFLWIYSYIPTFFNTLDKLWYIGIVIAIRKRFEAINKAIVMESLYMERKSVKQNIFRSGNNCSVKKYFRKPFFNKQIKPVSRRAINISGNAVKTPLGFATLFKQQISSYSSRLFAKSSSYFIAVSSSRSTLEVKLIKYCQLHATLCSAAKKLNDIYGFPILLLMGYGFLASIAHMYFFYCSNDNQKIPLIFRNSKSWWITALYLSNIAFKCISILYENWLTTLESKKTGICIHRCAMAADNNDTYEMINHLSLKLFNHPLNFNACGYFPLNMTTLFSFCGGVTTYLIILIQFNIEERQVKFKSVNGKPMALIGNDTYDSFMIEDVVNATRLENITST